MGARLTDEQLGTCEFAASTPWGQLHLAIPFQASLGAAFQSLADMPGVHGHVPDALGHAMSLSQAEPLIAELEGWCGQALAWQPVPAGLGREASHVAASVCDMHLAPIGSRLRVPLAMLQHLRLMQGLLPPHLSWPQWTYEATLAELRDELVRAQPITAGDMLLLPEAFQGDWPVALRPSGVGSPLQGLLNLDDARIESPAPLHAREDGVHADWRVVLSRPVQLDMGAALGWHEGDIDLTLDGERADGGPTDFGLHAQLRHRERGLVLSGMVVPVLLGVALWVRTQHQEV